MPGLLTQFVMVAKHYACLIEGDGNLSGIRYSPLPWVLQKVIRSHYYPIIINTSFCNFVIHKNVTPLSHSLSPSLFASHGLVYPLPPQIQWLILYLHFFFVSLTLNIEIPPFDRAIHPPTEKGNERINLS